MSQRNTLSLWQKLKQLLTGSAAQANEVEIDVTQTEPHDAHDNTEINSESDVKNTSEYSETDAFNSSASQHETSDTPIIDFLKQYFNDKQWQQKQ